MQTPITPEQVFFIKVVYYFLGVATVPFALLCWKAISSDMEEDLEKPRLVPHTSPDEEENRKE